MAETLGKTGTVMEVNASSGDVRVKFSSQRTFLFNPRVRCVLVRLCALKQMMFPTC
jgi:hypothetical protein